MIERILMPTDGSATARAAVHYVADIAKAEHASVTVLSVIHPQVWGDAAAYADADALRGEATRVADEAAKALADEGVDASPVVLEGDQVAHAIEQAADDQKAQLIVMGTHGHTGMTRAVIGSVADQVVRHAAVPVLLVPLRHAREGAGQPVATGGASQS